MAKKEILSIKIEASDTQVMQIVTGNSLKPLVQMLQFYNQQKGFYEERGYTITSENIEQFTFTVEKNTID